MILCCPLQYLPGYLSHCTKFKLLEGKNLLHISGIPCSTLNSALDVITYSNYLFLGRKAMTNLDRILKNRDITLPTKVHLVKALDFPVVMDRCESWTIKKAQCWRIDAFELWYRRLLKVPWTAGRSTQSILKEISSEYSLEGLMLKMKLQYFGHLMRRTDSLKKTLIWGKIEGRRSRGWQRIRWFDDTTDLMVMRLWKLWELVMDREVWRAAVHGVAKSLTWLSSWTELIYSQPRRGGHHTPHMVIWGQSEWSGGMGSCFNSIKRVTGPLISIGACYWLIWIIS